MKKGSKKEESAGLKIGDIVWWYKNGIVSNTPLPAIVVVNRGNKTLCINIFAPDGNWSLDGVKHKDDLNIKKAHAVRAGVWAERT